MAATAISQITTLKKSADSEPRYAAYLVKNITTNDTIDVGQTVNDFSFVTTVRAFHLTGTNVGTVSTPTVATTNLTIAQASTANDTILLVVLGPSHT